MKKVVIILATLSGAALITGLLIACFQDSLLTGIIISCLFVFMISLFFLGVLFENK
jgi:hypothetical protein